MKWSSDRGRFGRFVALGIANSLATYLIYLALLGFIGYALAYTVAYVCGIGISYAANSMLVFRTRMTVRSAATFPLVYVFQYVAGLVIIALLVEVLAVPAWLAPWIATAVLVPASFVLTRFVLSAKVPDAPRDHQ